CSSDLASIVQIIEQWLIRTKQFRINAKITFLQALVVNGSKTGIRIISPVAPVLIILTALENAFKVGLMTLITKEISLKNIRKFKQNSINTKIILKKYNDFPKYRAPQEFLNGISKSFPVLLLTAFFSPTSAGFYTLGRTVLSAPTQLIGKAVGDVFYPRITEASYNNEDLSKIIKKATLILAIVGIIPFGIVILFGPALFSFVFGSDWYEAGQYARWISLFVYFAFMNRPSVKSLPVISAQRFHLIFTIIGTILRLSGLVIGYYVFGDDLISVALFSIATVFVNIFLIFITIKLSKNFDN